MQWAADCDTGTETSTPRVAAASAGSAAARARRAILQVELFVWQDLLGQSDWAPQLAQWLVADEREESLGSGDRGRAPSALWWLLNTASARACGDASEVRGWSFEQYFCFALRASWNRVFVAFATLFADKSTTWTSWSSSCTTWTPHWQAERHGASGCPLLCDGREIAPERSQARGRTARKDWLAFDKCKISRPANVHWQFEPPVIRLHATIRLARALPNRSARGSGSGWLTLYMHECRQDGWCLVRLLAVELPSTTAELPLGAAELP